MVLSEEIEKARKEAFEAKIRSLEAERESLKAEKKLLELEKKDTESKLRIKLILKEGELKQTKQELKATKSELGAAETNFEQAQGVNLELAKELEKTKMELWSVQEENKVLKKEKHSDVIDSEDVAKVAKKVGQETSTKIS